MTANGTNYILHNAIPTQCTRPRENIRSYKKRERASGRTIDSLLFDAISEDGEVCDRRDRSFGERQLAIPKDN